MFADLPRQMISSHDNHFAFFFFFSFLHFSSPLLSPLFFHMDRDTRLHVYTHSRVSLSSSSFQTSFSLPSFSLLLSSTILSSNSTWKSLTRRARDERERERERKVFSPLIAHVFLVRARNKAPSLCMYTTGAKVLSLNSIGHSYYFPR